MFKMNRKVEYALIALRHMQQNDGACLVSAKEICDFYQAPFDLVSRVLQRLASSGILQSEKGPHGGYRLCRGLDKISVLDLIETTVEPIAVASCLSDDKADCAMLGTCNILTPMTALNHQLRQFFSQLSVAELFQANPAAFTSEALRRAATRSATIEEVEVL
ncbi:MAG: hypothetical protein RL095_2371 [Verrucomicrobiota bacterium]|jgi:Rrf2 family protein